MKTGTRQMPPLLNDSRLNSDDPASEMGWKQRAREEVRAGRACPACLGLGWVRPGVFPVGHPEFGKLERCGVCAKDELPAYLRRASGLAGWQAHASLGEYVPLGGERLPQLERVQALIQRGHGWLTLWGGYGRGKSFLLAAVVNHYLGEKKPAVYVTAGKLLDHLRDAYGPDQIGFSAAFSHWANCRVLAIDEADRFHETNWAMDKYRQLVDHRYNLACGKDGITLFACNAEPGEGNWPPELDYLASRMRHFDVCEAKGGDVRPAFAQGQGYTSWEDKF